MENWSSGNKPMMQHPETKHEDRKPLMEVKTTGLYPSSSSLSSPSSSEDSLELSTSRKDPLGDLYTKSEKDFSLSPSPASSSSPDVPNQTPQWSMISASPRGEMEAPPFPDEWNGANPSPMKSPPIHTMGHPPGYDPNRIPSSVFSSKPNNNPTEWSTASNESLFSIHMGNNSFSRDQFNMMYRSGELTKPEEWSNSPANPHNAQPEVKSNEKKSLPPNLPLPLVEVATDKEVKSASVVEGPNMQEKIVESPKIVSVENHENNIKEKTSYVDEVQHTAAAPHKSDGKVVPPNEASHASSPRFSNESGNSSSSFAFPVLLNDAGKTGSLKAASAKMDRPQPQPQPQPQPDSQPEVQPQSPPRSQPQSQPQSKQPESQPKLAATTWFSCFSCWPRCC